MTLWTRWGFGGQKASSQKNIYEPPISNLIAHYANIKRIQQLS